ncbi:MAG: glycosyltransferase family 1 protein [Phycisphaerales bacterium]|nr:MAG: glycosyltransferase family 1 protein [Phycisphaerales bacterium]
MGHEVVFVLPRAVGRGPASAGAPEQGETRYRVVGPSEAERAGIGATAPQPPSSIASGSGGSVGQSSSSGGAVGGGSIVVHPRGTPAPVAGAAPRGGAGSGADPESGDAGRGSFERTVFRELPATFSSPYPSDDPGFARGPGGAPPNAGLPSEFLAQAEAKAAFADIWRGAQAAVEAVRREQGEGRASAGGQSSGPYAGNLFDAAQRYARLAVSLARRETFDVIHAHDWLTYPAGLALRAVARKPLVVHVHATEFDRAGADVNAQVYDIERAGMHGADRVIVVSELTRSVCERKYGVAPERIDVVYNGVERSAAQPAAGARIERDDKIVLFLGRITSQKGPEYFIQAAKRVLEKVPNARFVVAGSGDQGVKMVEQAAAAGIGPRVLFTGFLRGDDVRRVFELADCYVMPSVSEPFGIAALEAMRSETPVIVSKQSGVAEVLEHALKVDFWDVEEMANKIVAVLRHPPLRETLREHGSIELHRLTWERAADLVVRSYHRAGVMVM